MKPSPDSTGVARAPEKDEFVSRKLIRPTLRKTETRTETADATNPEAREYTPRPVRERLNGKRYQQSAEQTHAEDFYYQKQMAAKTLMTVVLKNDETVQGVIEWYDRNSIKLTRSGKANLLIYKPSIRYMHKSDESR